MPVQWMGQGTFDLGFAPEGSAGSVEFFGSGQVNSNPEPYGNLARGVYLLPEAVGWPITIPSNQMLIVAPTSSPISSLPEHIVDQSYEAWNPGLPANSSLEEKGGPDEIIIGPFEIGRLDGEDFISLGYALNTGDNAEQLNYYAMSTPHWPLALIPEIQLAVRHTDAYDDLSSFLDFIEQQGAQEFSLHRVVERYQEP